MYLTRNVVAWAALLAVLYIGSTSAANDQNCTPIPLVPRCPLPMKLKKCKLCPKNNMNFMRICIKKAKKGCLSCPKKFRCIVPKKGKGPKNRRFGFCCKAKKWSKLNKKQKRRTRKRNFRKIRKAKKQLRKLIGQKKWKKLPKKLKGVLIQLKLCKKNLKKFKKMFKRMWKLFLKGASGRRIGRVLKKSRWGKKNKKVARKMARCLRGIKRRRKNRSKRSKLCPRRMKFVRVCKQGKGCVKCPPKYKCVTPKKGWGFCFRRKAWKSLSKKKKRAIKKKNFKKLAKTKKALKKALGEKWQKFPRYFRAMLIQLKLCVRKMKRFKKKFGFMWRMFLKGKPGKKIAKKLKQTKWGKKNKGAARQMSTCLKKKLP